MHLNLLFKAFVKRVCSEIPKIVLVMQITGILLLAACLQVSATAFGQKVTIVDKQVSLKEVFKEIRKQTDYNFIYSNKTIKEATPVTLNVKKADVRDVLDKVFSDQPFTYTIENKIIIVKRKILAESTEQSPFLQLPIHITGTVTDSAADSPIIGVTIQVKGSTMGTTTDANGNFSLEAPDDAVLVISYIGYSKKEIAVNGRTAINISLSASATGLNQLVVVGYGTQKKKDITGAISSVTSKDIGKVHGGSTVSTMLAGKISGLSFRMPDGRPGAKANIAIRNMGAPLYIVDGMVVDKGQFNNISPGDIASITILKDASAAIYGSRAANGVILVTTKRGKLNTKPKLSIDAYTGWQNLTKYPDNVLSSGYLWNLYAAEAQMNQNGHTSITPAEIAKWEKGTAYGYQSFDWASFIIHKNAPQTSIKASVSGGGKHTNYYLAVTHLNQDAVFKEYSFNRTNLQANINSRVSKSLQIGLNLSGRVTNTINPGIPGGDDYHEPLFAITRNRPTDHPFANNNPNYLNDIGHNNENAGLWNFARTGKYHLDWRMLQANFHAQYDLPIKGLSVKGVFGYYYANQYLTNHEYDFKTYSYNPVDSTYNVVRASNRNNWQERGQELITDVRLQGFLNYRNSFGKHHVAGTFVTDWYKRKDLYNHLHDIPTINALSIIQFNIIDQYTDRNTSSARIGYVGRFNYNYADKYYVELSGREDGSYQWPPDHRWGFFPSVSVGWRITQEPFFKSVVGGSNSILNDLKFRASYGQLGDDNVGISPFAYIQGYNYGQGTFTLDDGDIITSRNTGEPVTNITWYKSKITDIGADFSLWNGKLSGSLDYFYRKRTGLLASPNDVLIPNELGYSLPRENLNSDAQMGGDVSLTFTGKIGQLRFNINGNISYSRGKSLYSSSQKFGNSWNKYRNSSQDRWKNIFWGYQVIGQFKSQKQINNYPVNIDGQGNKTLLPGDFIYKDVNEDGVIGGLDMRPIGYNTGGQPNIYGGLSINLEWKGFSFTSDFSYEGLYSYNISAIARIPFQNTGNLIKDFTNRWHRENPFDLNSQWVSGKFPPLRFNDDGHSDYNKNSTFWLVNIRALRLRTLELGYTIPKRWTEAAKIENIRLYINTYNLFSIDNLQKQVSFVDPEVTASNAVQYPQSKFVNLGIHITF